MIFDLFFSFRNNWDVSRRSPIASDTENMFSIRIKESQPPIDG
jgi:hypothetical protein